MYCLLFYTPAAKWSTKSYLLMKTRLREFAHNHPALISTSPAAGGSSSHRTASPKCLLTAEAPYIACADTHTNSESQCQESRQMDMMMAAERRRAEEELLQPVHAACLALPVVQAPPRPGERAAARRDRFRRHHGERRGCHRAWIASERVRVRSAGCG